LHGNKAQNARVRALDAFRNGKVRILVATDIAARGIDVPNISHVVNYELPNEPESYVHRIGRTARAGAEGAALSFCDQTERPYLQAIERLMRSSVSVGEHRLAVTPATPPAPHKSRPQGKAPAAGKRRGRPNGRGFAGLPRAAQPSSRGERAHPLRGDLR
jgi:ATP-dependent RNA helicase RhlE